MIALHTEPDTEKVDVWIVDVDGTLAHRACVDHPTGCPETKPRCRKSRSPYDETRVLEDAPDPLVVELVRILAEHYHIIICSGRTDTCRTETQHWLHRHRISYTNFFMRKTGDNRKDSIIKEEILDNHILPSFNVVGVLDDRQQVVDMYRSRGLKVLQVDYGDF